MLSLDVGIVFGFVVVLIARVRGSCFNHNRLTDWPHPHREGTMPTLRNEAGYLTNAGYQGISLAAPRLGNVSMLKDETRAPITLAELQRRAVPPAPAATAEMAAVRFL